MIDRHIAKLRPCSLGLGLGTGLGGAGRGAVNLDFSGGSLPSGFSLTRASTGTYVDVSGVVQTAAIDAARFDYSFTSVGTFLGLLIEPQRTNVVLRSSDFSNASWVKAGVSASTNAGTNPDGSSTVQTITATGANGFLFQSSGLGVSVNGVASVWIRRRTGSGTIRLRSAATGTDTAITVTASWTRVAMPVTGSPSNQDCWVFSIVTSGDAVDLWNAQLEAASSETTSIATVASQVTRSADVASFWIPPGVFSIRYTFDNDSTQDVAVTPGAYTIPTTLNRSRIKRIVSL